MKEVCVLSCMLVVLASSGCIKATENDEVFVIFDADGNFEENMYYGEMWNYSANDTAWTFVIGASDVYYNMTNLTLGNVNGFSLTDADVSQGGSYLTANKEGLYKADLAFSFEGAGRALYGIAIVENFNVDNHRECYARRSISSAGQVGSVTVSCLIDVNVGDMINIQIEDEDSPVKNMIIHAINLNLIRIGDVT